MYIHDTMHVTAIEHRLYTCLLTDNAWQIITLKRSSKCSKYIATARTIKFHYPPTSAHISTAHLHSVCM